MSPKLLSVAVCRSVSGKLIDPHAATRGFATAMLLSPKQPVSRRNTSGDIDDPFSASVCLSAMHSVCLPPRTIIRTRPSELMNFFAILKVIFFWFNSARSIKVAISQPFSSRYRLPFVSYRMLSIATHIMYTSLRTPLLLQHDTLSNYNFFLVIVVKTVTQSLLSGLFGLQRKLH